MSRFNLANLNQTKYVVPVVPVAGSSSAVIPGIGSSQPVAKDNIDASEHTADIVEVGVSMNEFDYEYKPDQNLDLGIQFSNGNRYQYLAFKATPAGGCQIVTPATTVLVPIPDGTEDGVTYVEQAFGETIVVTAYVGNAVIPALPPNNTPTYTILPVLKSVMENKNCGDIII